MGGSMGRRALAGFVVIVVAFAGGVARAQVGSELASFSGPCASGNGRAIAYHAGTLYYTNFDYTNNIYEVNAATGACTGTINISRSVASLSWDSSRNVFWGGAYDGSGDVLRIDPVTATVTVAFNALAATTGDGSCCPGYIDGLSWDSSTDSLWFSNDLEFGGGNQKVFRFSPTGTMLQSFSVAPHGGCGNSGIAFDGSLLWLAFPCGEVIEIFDRGTTGGALATPLGSFSTGGFETEGMTFDNQTFSPKCAVWINNASYANSLTAYEVTCPLVADAYSVRLRVDGAPVPVQINALGDARAVGENLSADQAVQQVILPMGLGTISFGHNTVRTSVATGVTPLDGSASATSTVADVSLLDGMIQAHAIRSVATTNAKDGTAASDDAGTDIGSLAINGMQIASQPAQQQSLPLPTFGGSLTLNEHVAGGAGSDLSELEVRALHLQTTVQGMPVDLIIAAAYSGIAYSGALSSRPQTAPGIEPGPQDLPNLGAPPTGGNSIPNVLCPDQCYQATPLDGVSLNVPGLISVSRSRYAGGNSTNGYSDGRTDVSLLGGTIAVTIHDQIFHWGYSSSGYASDQDYKAIDATASGPSGLWVSTNAHRSTSSSSSSYGPYSASSYLDEIRSDSFANSPAGTAEIAIGMADAYQASSYAGNGSSDRARAPSIFVGIVPAGGSPIVVMLTPVEHVDGTSTSVTFTGYIQVNGQTIPIPPAI